MAFGDLNGDGKVSLEETILTYGMLQGLENNKPAKRGCCLLVCMSILFVITACGAGVVASINVIKKIGKKNR